MVEDTRADSRASRGAIDFQNELNEAQRRAATASPGAYLVIAGAGSGKTRTLVYRVAHLVEQGVAPESILLLTFTRRAAQEMLRRASEVLDERCRKVAGGTYHSFANLVLRRYAQHVGFDRGFTIIDRSDAVDMIGILRTEGGYDQKGRRFPRADLILSLWSKHINTQKPLEELLDEEAPQFIDDLAAIETLHRGYEERKKKQNVMDYDDLLIYLRRLLVEQPRVRKRLSSTYSHILVDEYQDTNRIQAHIAALLASGHGHIMVVGDDAQCLLLGIREELAAELRVELGVLRDILEFVEAQHVGEVGAHTVDETRRREQAIDEITVRIFGRVGKEFRNLSSCRRQSDKI